MLFLACFACFPLLLICLVDWLVVWLVGWLLAWLVAWLARSRLCFHFVRCLVFFALGGLRILRLAWSITRQARFPHTYHAWFAWFVFTALNWLARIAKLASLARTELDFASYLYGRLNLLVCFALTVLLDFWLFLSKFYKNTGITCSKSEVEHGFSKTHVPVVILKLVCQRSNFTRF